MHVNLGFSNDMRVAFSVILNENCQESFKRCMMLPRIHNSVYIVHEKKGGQGCVIVLPLARKAVQSLPLETLCPFNCPRQTLY